MRLSTNTRRQKKQKKRTKQRRSTKSNNRNNFSINRKDPSRSRSTRRKSKRRACGCMAQRGGFYADKKSCPTKPVEVSNSNRFDNIFKPVITKPVGTTIDDMSYSYTNSSGRKWFGLF